MYILSITIAAREIHNVRTVFDEIYVSGESVFHPLKS